MFTDTNMIVPVNGRHSYGSIRPDTEFLDGFFVRHNDDPDEISMAQFYSENEHLLRPTGSHRLYN